MASWERGAAAAAWVLLQQEEFYSRQVWFMSMIEQTRLSQFPLSLRSERVIAAKETAGRAQNLGDFLVGSVLAWKKLKWINFRLVNVRSA